MFYPFNKFGIYLWKEAMLSHSMLFANFYSPLSFNSIITSSVKPFLTQIQHCYWLLHLLSPWPFGFIYHDNDDLALQWFGMSISSYLACISFQFSSVAQLCLTLCDPLNCSTPVLPVHHQFLEFTQTHVHWVSGAIQPSHPLSSPSPPAPNPSPLSKAIYSM